MKDKIGIILNKKSDSEYQVNQVGVIPNDAVKIEITEEFFNDFSDLKNLSIILNESISDSDKIAITFSDSLIEELSKRSGFTGERFQKSITDYFNYLGKELDLVSFEKHGNLSACHFIFDVNEKENNVVSNQNEETLEKEKSSFDVNSIDCDAIISKLKEKIIGQDDALETVVNNIYNNQVVITQDDDDLEEHSKANILMDGPTGTGKTLILKQVANEFKLPIIIRPASMYSSAGYEGMDISEALVSLLEKADGNLEEAEKGVVVFDEFDKLAYRSRENGLEMKEAVQQDLLPFLSGTIISVEYKGKKYQFDTTKTTFIGIGAFTDLRERKIREELDENGCYTIKPEDYINDGMLREIIGRFSLITATKSLEKEDLVKILKESTISPLVQLKRLGEVPQYNKKIIYDDALIDKIADLALESDTGARALQTVVNGMRNVILPLLRDKNISEIELTDEILAKSQEVYVRKAVVKK